MIKISEAREGIKKLFNQYFNNYPVNHVVLLVWSSPIGNYLDHRSGAFDEMMEAEEYAEYLNQKYSKMGMQYQIYLDGWIKYKNWEMGS